MTNPSDQLAKEWATLRPMITGMISDVECAVDGGVGEGIDALTWEGACDARDAVERIDAILSINASSASPETVSEMLGRIEATIDAAERCMNASPFWDENSRYSGKALLDYLRSQIAAERAALSTPNNEDHGNEGQGDPRLCGDCEGWVDTSKASGSWGFMNHSHRLKPAVQRARECRPMVEGDIA